LPVANIQVCTGWHTMLLSYQVGFLAKNFSWKITTVHHSKAAKTESATHRNDRSQALEETNVKSISRQACKALTQQQAQCRRLCIAKQSAHPPITPVKLTRRHGMKWPCHFKHTFPQEPAACLWMHQPAHPPSDCSSRPEMLA